MKLNQVEESISAINTPTIGIAGEVRCVITGADGTVKTDTGYQKNLILNQGLEFFGGGYGSFINDRCAIGSGNSTPAITQTGLDAYIAQAIGTDVVSDYTYTDTGDGMYRSWTQKKYRFTGLSNVNISEVGLVSTGTASTNYYLTTRALIKDNLGAPTSISVKTGETLDIYYKIYRVVDTRDKSFVINVLDGNGGSVPYNVVIRPAEMVSIGYIGVWAKGLNNVATYAYTGELGGVTSKPLLPKGSYANTASLSAYTPQSYKLRIQSTLGLADANGTFRSIYIESLFSPFQARFGRVSDDAPLTKTSSDTLVIPLEFSWGRYEGAL